MVAKQRNFASLYLTEEGLKKEEVDLAKFSYNEVDAVKHFEGTHPQCMQSLIDKLSWKVDVNENEINMKFKDRLLYAFEKTFGYRLFEYKNFTKI
jgi:hypothetical protein